MSVARIFVINTISVFLTVSFYTLCLLENEQKSENSVFKWFIINLEV